MKYFYRYDDGENQFLVESDKRREPYDYHFPGTVVFVNRGGLYSVGFFSYAWDDSNFSIVHRHTIGGDIEFPVCLIDGNFIFPGAKVFVGGVEGEIFHAKEYHEASVILDGHKKEIPISEISLESQTSGWLNLYVEGHPPTFRLVSRGGLFPSEESAKENCEDGCHSQYFFAPLD